MKNCFLMLYFSKIHIILVLEVCVARVTCIVCIMCTCADVELLNEHAHEKKIKVNLTENA